MMNFHVMTLFPEMIRQGVNMAYLISDGGKRIQVERKSNKSGVYSCKCRKHKRLFRK